jgi:hypothetical protein
MEGGNSVRSPKPNAVYLMILMVGMTSMAGGGRSDFRLIG